MRVLAYLLVVLASLTAGSSSAVAGTQDPLESWWRRINEALDKAAEPHKIVPPTPVTVRWHPRVIWSGELSGELLDMLAVDLGDDGKNELVALTSKELLVLSRKRGLFDIRIRAPLPKKLASLRSRDAIGSLSVVHRPGKSLTLRARSSEREFGGAYQMVDGALALISEFVGYPVCHQGTIGAAPGRNYFQGSRASWPNDKKKPLAETLYSVRCTHRAIDPTGHAAEFLSAVSTAGELHLRCTGEAAHCQGLERVYQGVGDAHVIADVDNDGYPEVIHAGRGAAGADDSLVVMGHEDTGSSPLFEQTFPGGIVALAAGDFAGDGAQEVVAAVRKTGSKRVTLWLLN